VHRPAFDGWPQGLQHELRDAVREAITFQRDLHVKEEDDAAAAIKKTGGEIVELTAEEHKAFVSAVNPIYGEARKELGSDVLKLVDL
jgi:TRAP-type C4-dicarboxylate transport system substrate-binding protein